MSGAILMFVLLSLAWWFKPLSDNQPKSTNSVSVDNLQWRVGTAQQYRMQFDSSVKMNFGAANAAQTISVQMDSVLELQTLEVSFDSALVGIRLSEIDLQVNGDIDAATNAALAIPFRVRFAAEGFPESFEFAATVSGQHRSMLENILQTFQVTMKQGDTWVAQESNANGTYEASYQRSTPSQVEKTKSNFRGLPSTSPILDGADIVSVESIQLNPQYDWISTMTVDEVMRTQGQGGLAMEISNHATLELQTTAKVVAAPNQWNFVAVTTPPESAVATKPTMTPAEARRQILATLPEFDAATTGRTTFIHHLRDLLRVDESMPAILLEAMQTQQLNDRTRADLYLAFELAGTEAAQQALVSVIKDVDWSTQDAMRAVIALADVAQPKPDTIAALWETVEEVPASSERVQLISTATFALGSIGKTLRSVNDTEYGVLRDSLLTALASSGSDFYTEQRTNCIYAIGNTNDASLTSDIVPYLDDDAPQVRRAAALALGMLGTDQVAEELMSQLKQERNREVRGAIVESLVNWTTPSASAVATISANIRTEQDENTRYNMARFLGENLENFPENRKILQDLLRTEQSKRVRQNIADTLATTGQ
jgi:HEAT repeat protein